AAAAAAPASPASAATAGSAAGEELLAGSSGPAPNPGTCEIQVGRETVIEINKGDSSLGVSIVGGSDTALSSIIIHEVYEAGAAGIDGRLRSGDQIVAVGDRSLARVTHDEAKSAILQAGPRVRLRVRRDEKSVSEADLYELHRLELVRKPGRGLGFSIVARSRDEGVQVSDIIKGGAAESDNRLQPGDRILEINGIDVRKTPHSEVAAMLKGKVSFLIGRLKHVGTSAKSKRKCVNSTVFEVNLKRGSTSSADRTGFGWELAGSPGVQLLPPGGDVPEVGGGAFVERLTPKGPAAKSGKIRVDDELLSVNGQSVEGRPLSQTLALLSSAELQQSQPVVQLELRRSEEQPVGRLFVRLSRPAGQQQPLGFSIVGGIGSPCGDFPI
uniref:PDZ domain-containing protein n=1 Tax=Macrostomum lignano TaxID=282301 RepID=A0A1I8G8A8_9PLAT